MDSLQTSILAIVVVSYFIYLIFDLATTKRYKYNAIQLLVLALFVTFLNIKTGFPFPKVSFGSVSSELTFLLMFVFIIVGMVSNHLFFNEKLNLGKCLKPILVSPMILLPLYSLIDGIETLESMKTASLCLIAYQNGFFWKVLFEKIEGSIGE